MQQRHVLLDRHGNFLRRDGADVEANRRMHALEKLRAQPFFEVREKW